jgi:hypothetical protein
LQRLGRAAGVDVADRQRDVERLPKRIEHDRASPSERARGRISPPCRATTPCAGGWLRQLEALENGLDAVRKDLAAKAEAAAEAAPGAVSRRRWRRCVVI